MERNLKTDHIIQIKNMQRIHQNNKDYYKKLNKALICRVKYYEKFIKFCIQEKHLRLRNISKSFRFGISHFFMAKYFKSDNKQRISKEDYKKCIKLSKKYDFSEIFPKKMLDNRKSNKNNVTNLNRLIKNESNFHQSKKYIIQKTRNKKKEKEILNLKYIFLKLIS